MLPKPMAEPARAKMAALRPPNNSRRRSIYKMKLVKKMMITAIGATHLIRK